MCNAHTLRGAVTHEKLGSFNRPDFDLDHGAKKMRNVLITGSRTPEREGEVPVKRRGTPATQRQSETR